MFHIFNICPVPDKQWSVHPVRYRPFFDHVCPNSEENFKTSQIWEQRLEKLAIEILSLKYKKKNRTEKEGYLRRRWLQRMKTNGKQTLASGQIWFAHLNLGTLKVGQRRRGTSLESEKKKRNLETLAIERRRNGLLEGNRTREEETYSFVYCRKSIGTAVICSKHVMRWPVT